jgi:hypothetical protein
MWHQERPGKIMNRLQWLLRAVGDAHNRAVVDALADEEVLLQDAAEGNTEYQEWRWANPSFRDLLQNPPEQIQ